MSFNPERLSVARQRRLLNQKGFAELAGLSTKTISRYEKGLNEPDEDAIARFVRILRFPREFFFGGLIEFPDAELVSFRSQKAMTAAVRDAALSAGALGFLVSDWVEERFSLPEIDLPDLQLSAATPEAAARAVRAEWGLGEQPISNMIHLLESHGVRVLSLAENSVRVNAFSLWRDDKPYVFLNTIKSAENSRFDAAHELGHLVLHQDGKPTGRVAEDQANRFASAFLMPKADVLAHVGEIYSLGQMIRLKNRWKVSLAALNYRLHKIGVTTDWGYRDFCIQLSTSGFNKKEPEPIERERSMVWEKILKILWSDKKTFGVISTDLFLPESEVSAFIYGVLSGGEKPSPPDSGLSLVLSENVA
jgi:Zn-dependent peptidase ImmA (M78 family)/DNA-binding XRE family transcriptional regulator